MGKQISGCTKTEFRTPHINLHDNLEHTYDIWREFSKNIKVDFWGSEISADPPESVGRNFCIGGTK
jgi:hypothetical protein